MRETALAVVAAFVALCTLSSFSGDAVFIFGVSCAVIVAGILVRKAIVGIAGIFMLGILSPFAMQYERMAEGFTLIAVTALVVISLAVLTHVAATSDEKRRFDWRVDRRALLISAVMTLVIANSIVLISAIGVLGTFLGDTETTGARVIILAFATALACAIVLVPTVDESDAEPA